jgi:hypothetical protein
MSRHVRTFHSLDGQAFRVDIYAVLAAFNVTCPARQHAIYKLLMLGQRGAKDEVQDLEKALVSVCRAVAMTRARLPEDDTLTIEPEPMAEPESKPKLVTWRRCVRIKPKEINDDTLYAEWHPSGHIPKHWYPIEAHTQSVGTFKQLPEGEEPSATTKRRV